MKRLLLAGLAAALLGIGAPAAHASHAGYRGGCSFDTVNDTTPGGQLGGDTTWNGVVNLAAVFTDSTANRVPTGAYGTVSCELRVDGVSRGTVLGPTSGLGQAHDARPFSFVAPIDSFVILCDHVTIDGETIVDCGTTTDEPFVPQPIQDGVTFLVDNLLDDVVNPVLLVAPDGDVSVLGEKLLDCVPYDESSRRDS